MSLVEKILEAIVQLEKLGFVADYTDTQSMLDYGRAVLIILLTSGHTAEVVRDELSLHDFHRDAPGNTIAFFVMRAAINSINAQN